MQSMREAWTDERLDDLNHRVDEGFRRVDGDLRALRGEMNGRFDALQREMNTRFDALQRTMIHAAIGMTAAFITGFAALAGLIATQL
jgi:hypothetical protein